MEENKEPLNKDNKVPKIRFKKFSSAYKKEVLGNIFNLSVGGDLPKEWSKIKNKLYRYPIYSNSSLNEGLYGYSKIFTMIGPCITITGRGSIGCAVYRKDNYYPIVRLVSLKAKQDNVDLNYATYAINRIKFLNESSGVPQLTSPQIASYKIYIPNITEQKQVRCFLNELNTKEEILKQKIQTLKKYRKGLIQVGLRLIYTSKSVLYFSELYSDLNEKNLDSLGQYTVGKNGLKPISESKYDLHNHKVFFPNCLLIGIGIDEIATSVNTTGSVSNVYSVYKINKKDFIDYTKFFLKPILLRNKSFITRKSTRREYEIDIKELLSFKLPITINRKFNVICESIDKMDTLIGYFLNKLHEINNLKSFLLKNMFI